MTRLRHNPYIHVTWVAKALVGDRSCLWATWFKANHEHYARVPSGFDSARWNMEHTDLMNELISELEGRGCEVFIEKQNDFKVVSSRSGTLIHGVPDIIAVHPDGGATIYDAKTGQPSASHVAQVQLYMYLVPRAQNGRWRGTTFEGALVYPGGHEVTVPAESVNEAFIGRVTKFVQSMVSDKPARRVPSLAECRWCDLTRGDCPDRMESEVA